MGEFYVDSCVCVGEVVPSSGHVVLEKPKKRYDAVMCCPGESLVNPVGHKHPLEHAQESLVHNAASHRLH